MQTGPFTIDVGNREDVRQSWNLVHEATADMPTGWSGGSVASCTARHRVTGLPRRDPLAHQLVPGHGRGAAR